METITKIPQNDTEYFALERMSNSALKNFRRSPRHYLYEKNRPKSHCTPAMIFGSAFHCYILESERFKTDYAVKEKVNGTTKAGKEYNTKFAEENAGKIIVDTEAFEDMQRMRDAIFNDAFASDLVSNMTEVEKPFLWNDELTGVPMKGKMDGVNPAYTLDLKTCINAHPDVFGRTAMSDYLTQPAVYRDARHANKMDRGDFYFIAIEKEAPYGVSVIKCDPKFLEHGRAEYRDILEDFIFWQEMGSPNVGYEWRAPLGYHTLNLPNWMK